MSAGKILNTSNALYPSIVRALSGDLVTCQMRSLLGDADTSVQPGGVVVTDVVPFTTAWTATQGIARNANNWFAIDTTALRKYDLTGALLATNSTPFTGLPAGLDHCGDGFSDDNFLYLAISNYNAGLATVKVIAWFNVSDLSLAGYFDLSALPSEFNASGVCKSRDGSEFWVTSYNPTDSDSDSTTKLWRFNSSTGVYIGQYTLGARVVGAQGVAYRPDANAVYITSWKNPDSRINVYDGTTFALLQVIDPTGINSGVEIEGVICYENKIYTHSINNGPRVLSGNMFIPSALVAGDPFNFLSSAQMGDAGTVLIRWRPATLPSLQTVLDNQANANTWESWCSSSGVLSWRIAATTPRCNYTGIVAGNEYIIAQTWSKSGTNVEIKLAVNGLYRSTATQVWTAIPADGLWIGGGNAGNSQSDAEFRDVVVFNKVLSDAELLDAYTNFDSLYASESGAPAIYITTPVAWQLNARNPATNTGSISITGTYTDATPTAIEARWNGGAWSVIDAAPAGGSYSGSLTGLTAGNGALEVRLANATTVTALAPNVAIGAKFLFWGQSNFSGRADNAQVYTGNAGWFHKFTVTNNQWQQGADPFDTATSSGSLYPILANLLALELGCPVGFIGVAMGSTALAAWQPGQTLNNRMIDYYNSATSNSSGGIEAVISWIGESDADAGTIESDFKSRYTTVIDQLKTLTGADSLLVAPSGLNTTGYANVRQWISDIAATSANTAPEEVQMWPLFQKIHYETNTETALAADAVFDGIVASFYTLPSPFSGDVSKQSIIVSDKTLSLSSGFIGGVVKSNFNYDGKQLTIITGSDIPVNLTLNKSYIEITGKQLGITVGTSIPFSGNITKQSVSYSGKNLQIVTGTSVEFIADLNKSAVTVVGKELSFYTQAVVPVNVDINKGGITFTYKNLVMGVTTYPIIESSRLFLLNKGNTQWL